MTLPRVLQWNEFCSERPHCSMYLYGVGGGQVVKSYGFGGNLNSEYPGTCSVKTYRLMLFLTLHFYFKLKKKGMNKGAKLKIKMLETR